MQSTIQMAEQKPYAPLRPNRKELKVRSGHLDPDVPRISGQDWSAKLFSLPTYERYIEYQLNGNGSDPPSPGTSSSGQGKGGSQSSETQQLEEASNQIVTALKLNVESLENQVKCLQQHSTAVKEPEYETLFKVKQLQHRIRQLQMQIDSVLEMKLRLEQTGAITMPPGEEQQKRQPSKFGRQTLQRLKWMKSRLPSVGGQFKPKWRADLEMYMGSVVFQPRRIAGFARLMKGDEFDFVIKHGPQKIRMHTKVGLDKQQQAWYPSQAVFKCFLGESFELKVQEVKSFSKSTLLDTYLYFNELAVAEPIVFSFDLTYFGTLKLYTIVSWDPLDFSSQQTINCSENDLQWRTVNTVGRKNKIRTLSQNHTPVSRSLSACPSQLDRRVVRPRSFLTIPPNDADNEHSTPVTSSLERMLEKLSTWVKQLSGNHPQLGELYRNVERLRFNLSAIDFAPPDDLTPSMANVTLTTTVGKKSLKQRHSSYEMSAAGASGERQSGHFCPYKLQQIHATLHHHVVHCTLLLQQVSTTGPLFHKEKRSLQKLEEESEILGYVADSLSGLLRAYSIVQIFADFNVTMELQNCWLAACQNDNHFVLPMSDISEEMRKRYGRIVSCYQPTLLAKVMASLRHKLSDESRWVPHQVSVFQYVVFFRDQMLPTFVESLTYETWIVESLKTRDENHVHCILQRLEKTPVIPPGDCLRYIATMLTDDNEELRRMAEHYLTTSKKAANNEMTEKLTAILEHEDPLSRRGACKALAVLKCKAAIESLIYLGNYDRNASFNEVKNYFAKNFGVFKCDMVECTPSGVALSAKFSKSFAYVTVKDRLPVILTKVIDALHRDRHAVISKYNSEGGEDVKRVIGKLSELRYRMVTDKTLKQLETKLPDAEMWENALLNYKEENGKEATWFSCPWLLCECYFHRKIVEILENSKFLKSVDPYVLQKQQSFVSSLQDIVRVGLVASKVFEKLAAVESFNDAREDLWQLFQVSLWGNRGDLSLSAGELVNLEHFSNVDNLRAFDEQIVCNHFEDLFSHLFKLHQASAGGQPICIDILLDNSGMELFADLCLGDAFLELGLAETVRFHAKSLPFFVSDTTAADFCWTLEMLRSSAELSLCQLGKKWQSNLEAGKFQLNTHYFWTSPYAYDQMASVAEDLHNHLTSGDLVILKGDLNYRKLLGDLNWPPDTSVTEAFRAFLPTALLAMRTCKADLVAGLASDQCKLLNDKDANWMTKGHYAVFQFRQAA